ncbi:unnamed protein product, partial [Porites evermanni]
RRWLFARGSNWKASTGNVLIFWIGGRTWRFNCIKDTTVDEICVMSMVKREHPQKRVHLHPKVRCVCYKQTGSSPQHLGFRGYLEYHECYI